MTTTQTVPHLFSRMEACNPRTILDECVFRYDGRISSAVCMGTQLGKKKVNWSLGPLQQPSDAKQHPELCERIATVLQAMGVTHCYAPRPDTFNAEFIHKARLSTAIPLAPGIWLNRNKNEPADATEISEPGEAIAFSQAGCSFVDITEEWKRGLVASHMGRDCIVPRARIIEEHCLPADMRAKPRLHRSVVDTLMHQRYRGKDPASLHVHIYGAPPGILFPHPIEGSSPHIAFNKAMREYCLREWGKWGAEEALKVKDGVMAFDQPKLIEAQFKSYGITSVDLRFAYISGDRVSINGTLGAPRNFGVVAIH